MDIVHFTHKTDRRTLCTRIQPSEYTVFAMSLFFAELGRNPALSLAELCAVRPAGSLTLRAYHGHMALFESDTPFLAEDARRLGGTVRFGEIIHSGTGVPHQEEIIKLITSALQAQHPLGKRIFGLSAAPLSSAAHLPSAAKLRAWGLSIKKEMAGTGSVRLMTATTRLLSPAAIHHNNVITAGGDFILLVEDKRWHIARTTFVHDFEGQAAREFDRPVSNAVSGMLPVQLARSMVNLSGKTSGTLLDPFCGTGTVPMEAMHLGWPQIVANDISADAVAGAKENCAWLAKQIVSTSSPTFYTSPAEQLMGILAKASIDAIVTEPTLGPAQRGASDLRIMAQTAGELRTLYVRALTAFHPLLTNNGRVVMVFPRFHHGRVATVLDDATFSRLGYRRAPPLPTPLLPLFSKDLTPGGNLRYARADAKVEREIVLLDKMAKNG